MTRSPLGYLRAAVRSRVEREGLRPLSKRTGIPIGQLRSMMEGRAPLSTSIEFIASALNLEFYIGPPRESVPAAGVSGMVDKETPAWARSVQHELHGLRSDLAQVIHRAKDDAPPGTGSIIADAQAPSEHHDRAEAVYVAIRTLDPAQGGGPDIERVPVSGQLAFHREWLKRHGMDADRCTIVKVSGDAMEPTLPEGCAILVDHSRRRRRLGHIFALQVDNGVMVRRAGRDQAGRWILIGDHHLRAPVPWSRAFKVAGEVRWMATVLA